jgi:hypothetical protein
VWIFDSIARESESARSECGSRNDGDEPRPKAAAAASIAFGDLLGRIVDASVEVRRGNGAMDDRRIVRGTRFLPVNRQDMAERGWDQVDFAFVSGDAYVDHPSFGHAIISGFSKRKDSGWESSPSRTGGRHKTFSPSASPHRCPRIVRQSRFHGVRVYGGQKKAQRGRILSGRRSGKAAGRATIVYCNRIRELWGDIPLIIGGIEASLRRFSHYDYWSDSLRRSMLVDSRADLLVYGMGSARSARSQRGCAPARA